MAEQLGPHRTNRRGRILLSVLLAGMVMLAVGSFSIFSPFGRSQTQSSLSQPWPTPGATAEVPGDTLLVVGSGDVDVEGGVVRLMPALPGMARTVLAKAGQRVHRNDVLIRLDDRIARAQQEQADAALENARIKLAQARRGQTEHELQLAQQDQAILIAEAKRDAQKQQKERLAGQFTKQLVGREDVQAAEDQLRALEAGIKVEKIRKKLLVLDDPDQALALAEANVRSARAAADAAHDQLSKYTLTAPSDGEVLHVHTHVGENVAPSEPALQFLPDRPWIVRCEIEQDSADRVRIGMACDIFNDRLDAPEWHGKVQRCSTWIAPQRLLTNDPLRRNDNRTMECIVTIDGPRSSLRIGQRVRVVIRSGNE